MGSSHWRGFCERIEVGIAAVTGWGISELACLPARGVFAYAANCLSHRAVELAQAVDVALLPIEAFTGGSSLRKSIERDIRRMLGEPPRGALSAAERAAVVQVEREIAREFPFYLNDARLTELHERYGRLRLRR